MSVLIRSETAGDQNAIRDIQRLAFKRIGEGRLVDDLRQTGEAVISLVAEQEGRVVGHALFSQLQAPMPALAFGPLAVHPDFQKRGIGSALIKQGLAQARHEDWSAIFVLGDPVYYARFGFDADAAKGYLSPYTGAHFMILPLKTQDIPDTGEIVYPAAFKLLD